MPRGGGRAESGFALRMAPLRADLEDAEDSVAAHWCTVLTDKLVYRLTDKKSPMPDKVSHRG